MAALTADVHIPHLGTPTKIALAATGADIFYAGAIVWLDVTNNTGQVQVASIADGDVIVGICAKRVTTTAAGDLVEVYVDGVHSIPAAAFAATDVGSIILSDISGTISDNPADLVASVDATTAAGDARLGVSLGMNQVETSSVWCRLDPGMRYATLTGWESPI